MKRLYSILLCLALICLAFAPFAYAADDLPFGDIPAGAYYQDAVKWAYESHITEGTSAGSFSPDKTCTRAQVVTFLWRSADCPEPASLSNPFTDIRETDYFYKPVLWAVENHITDGTSSSTFSPSDTCKNSHILTFIYRAMGEPGKTGQGTWYSDAYNWAYYNGLLDGSYSGTYDINGFCSRGSVVQYLYKYDTVSSQEPGSVTDETADILPPEKETGILYVLNMNSKKVHSPGCSSVPDISSENKVSFRGALSDLEAYGFQPCGICHADPDYHAHTYQGSPSNGSDHQEHVDNTYQNAGSGTDPFHPLPADNNNGTNIDRSLPAGNEYETTYILNTNTKKFHYPYCSSVQRMAEKNKKEYTGSREEIINAGYVPCKICDP